MLFVQKNPPREQWLESTGGLNIFTRHWRPAGTSRAALVICHGVNSHGGQYLRAAEEFAAAGFAVTALDLRGRGRSEGERFHVEDVADLSQTIELAKSHDPGLPRYLLGHSAGGVVSRERVMADIIGWIEARLPAAAAPPVAGGAIA